MGKGLGVLHERGPSVHTALEGPVAEDRCRDAIASPVGKCAFLARDVSGRRRDEFDAHRIRAALADRVLEHLDRRRSAVDSEIGVSGTDGRRGRLDAVEDEVRYMGEEHCVLAARGLAFHCVRDDDGSAARGSGASIGCARDDRLHLSGRREPASASSAQA